MQTLRSLHDVLDLCFREQQVQTLHPLMCLVDQEPRRPWSPTEPEGKNVKRPRDDSFLPLVIPVSVPVRRLEPSSPGRDEAAPASNWPHRPPNAPDFGPADHKLSVIVTRRRSLRNSLTEDLEVSTFISLVFNFFIPCCHKRLCVILLGRYQPLDKWKNSGRLIIRCSSTTD